MRITARITLPDIQFKPEAYAKGVQRAVSKWAASVANDVQTYPHTSVPSYRRTGHLGAGWRVQKTPTQAKVFNDVEYATYVEGPEQVGWAGSRGWPVLSEVASEHKAELLDDVREAAMEALS